ncbi:MAG: antitoxin [Terracidiphilus sp.]|jgi:antitoxin ChpS
MLTTNLRKVGGSVMLAVPRAVLEMMRLEAGATVQLAVEGERLIIEPQKKLRYSLDELLNECQEGVDATAQQDEDRAWVNLAPVGREL